MIKDLQEEGIEESKESKLEMELLSKQKQEIMKVQMNQSYVTRCTKAGRVGPPKTELDVARFSGTIYTGSLDGQNLKHM